MANIMDKSHSQSLNMGEDKMTIKTTTVDKFVAQQNIQKLNLIKMDIEGAEPDVLSQCEQTMRTLKPVFLVCTYHDPKHYELLSSFFREHGYSVNVTKGVISTEGEYGPRPYFRKGVICATPI
jgi:hypothetical protein